MGKEYTLISLLVKKYRYDVIFFILFPIIATFVVVFFKLNYIGATLVLFGMPSLYLSAKNPKIIKRALFTSLIFSIIFDLIIDYPAYIDGSWYVPNSVFRFFGNSTPIEDIVWAFLWVYFAIAFWEYFFDKSYKNDHFSPHIKYLYIIGGLMLSIFFGAYFLKPELLNISYFYLKFGIILFAIPILGVLLRYHRLIPKVFTIGLYFLYISILTEFVGLTGSHWIFNGQHFVMTFNFFGNTIPLEEMIFWWSLGVPGIICWYELFLCDEK